MSLAFKDVEQIDKLSKYYKIITLDGFRTKQMPFLSDINNIAYNSSILFNLDTGLWTRPCPSLTSHPCYSYFYVSSFRFIFIQY